MAWFNRKKEERAHQDVTYAFNSSFMELLSSTTSFMSSSDALVNNDTALGVPAVWAAVNMLAGTIAGLPLNLYRKTKNGREKVNSKLSMILHDAVTDSVTSFQWRKYTLEQKLTGGRGLSYIERNAVNEIVNIRPLDPAKVTISRVNGALKYNYTEGANTYVYDAVDIIDLPFMLKSDGITHRSPITSCKNAIGLAISATQYASKYLSNGGVPPFVINGNFQTQAALKRASDEFQEAIRVSAKENKQALVMPFGMEAKPIGGDPERSQLEATQRFCIEQIARIYSIPPTFLQDLTHGTMSNTEQQDLHYTKHTIKHHVEQFEQELNLKLFGRFNNKFYVEFNLDGLLRGDFPTRMAGYAQGVQSGILKPAEARDKENLPFEDGSDKLFIQGATVPMDMQVNTQGISNV